MEWAMGPGVAMRVRLVVAPVIKTGFPVPIVMVHRVGEDGEGEPCTVGVEQARWAVGEAVVFEVADGEFDNGVGAVVKVFDAGGSGAVGDERVVVPVREQGLLVGVVPGCCRSRSRRFRSSCCPGSRPWGCQRQLSPSGAMSAMRRRIVGIWRTVMEYSHRFLSQNSITVFDQNPESQRNTTLPVQPAWVRWPRSSWRNRFIPRAVFAEPLRIRAANTSPVSARNARSG